MQSRTLSLSLVLAGVVIGALGVVTYCFFTEDLLNPQSCDNFELLNPYVRCEPDDNLAKKKEFTDFKVSIQEKIYAWMGQGRIHHASVYLRDLQFGPWMGIDEQETYSAASLLKVAVMLTLLRQEELHPGILEQEIFITPDFISNYMQTIQPTKQIDVGKTYTVDELLEYMIVHSDNNATNVLNSYIESISLDGPLLIRTLEELGFIGEFTTDDSLTVKQTASMFRLLYNASYLHKDLSQKALELLSRTTFLDGIRSSTPASMRVAHKFGERILSNDKRQLHDCGIVYHPGGQYLLCIMTQGNDVKELERVIHDISAMVYAEMDERHRVSSAR